MSKRSRLLSFGLPIIGLGSLLMGAVMVADNQPNRDPEEPPRVPTRAPRVDTATAFIGAIGVSEPQGEAVSLTSHVSGIVERVDAAVGSTVRAGDPLFSVDRRRATAELALREAAVEVAKSEVASLRASIPPARAKVSAARAALLAAEAQVGVSQAELEDRRNLFDLAEAVTDPRAISREELDRRRYARDQASARLAVSEASIVEARAAVEDASAELSRLVDSSGELGPDLMAALERVRQAEAERDSAQTELDLHTVRAPLDADVLQLNIRPGEFASAAVPSEAPVVLGRSGRLDLRVEVDEVDIPRFNPEARAWASPRGRAEVRLELEFVLREPLVVPKTNLAGRTSELIDTRVLQVVYALPDTYEPGGVGQQFDVYIEVGEE